MKTGPKRDWKKSFEVVQKLINAFSVGCNKKEACIHAGISRQTLENWLENDPELFDMIQEVQASTVIKARTTIYNNLDKPAVAKDFLKTHSLPDDDIYGAHLKRRGNGDREYKEPDIRAFSSGTIIETYPKCDEGSYAARDDGQVLYLVAAETVAVGDAIQ